MRAGGDIVIASNTPGVDGSEPCGEYMVNGNHTFSAASQMVNGSLLELTGYTLEKWDVDTDSWAFVTNSEASAFAYTNSVQNGRMRLMWNWVAATPRWTNDDGTGSFDSAANWAGGRVPHSGDYIVNISGNTTIAVANTYNLGDIDLTTVKRIPLFKVGSSAMLPAPETLQFVDGIPKGWELKTAKEGYGYDLMRRQFMVIVK